MKKLYSLFVLCLFVARASAQIVAPDTVCVNTPVNFTTPFPGSTYAWSVGSNTVTSQTPGNAVQITAGQVSVASAAVMRNDNGNYYGFVTNAQTGQLLKLNFGTNAYSTAPTVTNLGNFGLLTSGHTQCIDIVKDSSNWYGFIAEDVSLVRLDFGSSLNNTPTATKMSFAGKMAYGMQVSIRKTGNQWVGFCGNFGTNAIIRFDFGNSLLNTPAAVKLPDYGLLNGPCYFSVYEADTSWYMLVNNLLGSQLVRYSFGSNIMNNTPAATSLGNPGNALNYPRGIEFIRDCSSFYALAVNETGNFVKLDFQNNITGTPSATVLGALNTTGNNLATLSPFWYHDTLNFMSVSFTSNNLYRIPVCSLPSGSTVNYYQAQYIHSFPVHGVYNVTAMCSQGEAFNGRTFCKQVVVIDSPSVNIIASGNVLSASGSTGTYQWYLNGAAIPGATNATYTANQSGVYTVVVTGNGGCASTVNYTYFRAGINGNNIGTAGMQVYPNPASGLVSVAAEGLAGNEADLCVYNTMGQQVSRQHTKLVQGKLLYTIDVSALPRGIYNLCITTGGGQRAVRNIVLQ